MKTQRLLRACALTFALTFANGIVSAATPAQPLVQAEAITTAPGVTVNGWARGFNAPRGLKYGYWPINGYNQLHVAEGGTGGTTSTASLCKQVDPPIGPYTGSRTGGRVSVIAQTFDFPRPSRTTITDQLPSSQTSVESGSLVSGAADVAFIGSKLYVLVSGGGCSHGVPYRPNAVVRIDNGRPVLVANLSTWLRAHPGSALGPDVEPDGTWYSMVALNGMLYLIEPNHGLFVRVNPLTGAVTQLLDVSGVFGRHVVPTALAYHKGYFYIANLGTFPIVDGTQRVWRVLTNPLRLQRVATGTAIVALAFDANDAMYILQLTSGAPGPTPGMGSIVRIRPGGQPQTIVSGLTFPTGMTIAPGGRVMFVSHMGFGAPGSGEILRVDLFPPGQP
ncbi:ScyD/ScyE family protein [Lysobacter sp. A6]|uniref:ScyD/ScyE family protein n=1 Tax=Noviluteimonas lactosilytica TaxID=2888523 RepID=A0ABS8JJN9_9GAMM|nr:ScyD/ScyE family protein [Lysobacter lactosilyticus]MCC8363814.1 ScyD/ScyE family protein [Lysobacter lactosilyticus]